MKLKHLARVRLQYGEPPAQWDTTLRTAAFGFALISPLFYLAALTGLSEPAKAFDFQQAPITATISFAVPAIAVALYLLAGFLLIRERALGISVLLISFCYVVPFLSAVGVSVAVLGSIPVILGTFLLGVWSAASLCRVNAVVSGDDVALIAAERIFHQDDVPYLRPAGAFETGGTVNTILRKNRRGSRLFLELCGAFLVIFAGPLLIPVSIASDDFSRNFAAPLACFVNIAIVLAARKMVNGSLLTIRGMIADAQTSQPD